MKSEVVNLKDISIQVYSLNTVVVGSGAAGLNAADRLHNYGQKDIVVVTEGMNMGTSRNTGSDKQTYYKLTLSGGAQDSIEEMANTLFDGGCMDGDLALVEAALSTQCFYHLVEIGVPFPHNKFGEYVGYKTDHDPRQRATSAGPLTSKYMTEKLQEQVINKGITIFDGYQVIGIIVDKMQNKSVGLITLNVNGLEKKDTRYAVFNCTNIVYATGGPAGMYSSSVYPESQTGSSGIAFEAGVEGKNLTESQYGIASVKFRWNLSGTYQQALPRYISTNQDGADEREFLNDYFPSAVAQMNAIFLKGYQWPFDPRKVKNYGSSLIDILVYNETVIKNRKVYLDYTRNTSSGSREDGSMDFGMLGEESYKYLSNSGALLGKPIERLAHMNQPAIDLYRAHGIDLASEYLEISVCAQHNNGGLEGNEWWESSVRHFFPVGEVNGTHGIYRPGGSALNSGQVGSTRAAQYIAARYKEMPVDISEFLRAYGKQIEKRIEQGEGFVNSSGNRTVRQIREEVSEGMSRCGAHIRSLGAVKREVSKVKNILDDIEKITHISSLQELPYAFHNYDILLTQYVYLSSIADYIENGGRSRGSYLIKDEEGELPHENLSDIFRFSLDSGVLSRMIQRVKYENGVCSFTWNDVRPIPMEDNWFESIWNSYRNDLIIR